MRTFRAIACTCLVLPAVSAVSQQFVAPRDDAATFLSDADDEAKRGTSLFYEQSYLDTRKERVSLHGSVYGVLRDVKLTGCDLEASVQVFDLFSGFVKDSPIGEQQDLTEYSIRFRLTPQLAAALNLIQARPAQLAHTMHTKCRDDPSCTFNWLRIHSTRPDIHERVVLNRFATFDGNVQQVLAPVSSPEAGKQLMRDLQMLAASTCK